MLSVPSDGKMEAFTSRTRNTKHLAVLCLFIVVFSYRKHQIQANKQKHSSDHRKGHLYTVKQKYSCFFFSLPMYLGVNLKDFAARA